jgi:hypothetical protein
MKPCCYRHQRHCVFCGFDSRTCVSVARAVHCSMESLHMFIGSGPLWKMEWLVFVAGERELVM